MSKLPSSPDAKALLDLMREHYFAAAKQPGKVSMDATMQQLGADDLDLVETAMAAEDRFGVDIPDNIVSPSMTPRTLLEYIKAVKAAEEWKKRKYPVKSANMSALEKVAVAQQSVLDDVERLKQFFNDYKANHTALDLLDAPSTTLASLPNYKERLSVDRDYPLYISNPDAVAFGNYADMGQINVTDADLSNPIQQKLVREYLTHADIKTGRSEANRKAGLTALKKIIKEHNINEANIPAMLAALTINNSGQMSAEHIPGVKPATLENGFLTDWRADLLSSLSDAAGKYLYTLPDFKNRADTHLLYTGTDKSANMAGLDKVSNASADYYKATHWEPGPALLGEYGHNVGKAFHMPRREWESDDEYTVRRWKGIIKALQGKHVDVSAPRVTIKS